MLRDIPVLGIASNTHKIEGLMQDAGVGPAGIISANHLSITQLQNQWRETRERRGEVQRYVQNAKIAIQSMFDTIANTTAAKVAA
jgi:polysaccharide pyruvyl transferase WcaK-like protein